MDASPAKRAIVGNHVKVRNRATARIRASYAATARRLDQQRIPRRARSARSLSPTRVSDRSPSRVQEGWLRRSLRRAVCPLACSSRLMNRPMATRVAVGAVVVAVVANVARASSQSHRPRAQQQR
jgi:hypothetical protein